LILTDGVAARGFLCGEARILTTGVASERDTLETDSVIEDSPSPREAGKKT